MNAAATMTATKKYDITVVPRSFYLEDRSDPSGGVPCGCGVLA